MTEGVISRHRHATVQVRIVRVDNVASDVLAVTLEPTKGHLQTWEAGAHVDIALPSGAVRQYSLCGHVEDRNRYTVAVLRQPGGRGGSEEFHTIARPGVELTISHPRNRFVLQPAESYLFLAGGIGITPILPMVGAAEAARLEWQLHYGARTAETLAFRDVLSGFAPERVHLHPEDVGGRIDFVELVASFGVGLIYACGPCGMLEAVEGACEEVGRTHHLVTERFTPLDSQVGSDAGSFEVELAATGGVLLVPPDRSILEVVREAGVDVESSCEEGFCGTCETRVVAGLPDHRDDVLSDEERESNQSMMICVGRARTPRLVLDL